MNRQNISVFDYSNKISKKCFVCNNLFIKVNTIIEKIIWYITKKEIYEFNSFLIGSSLPSVMFENEDYLRSLLKIKGRENIKSEFNRLLRERFEQLMKKKLEIKIPDLFINIIVNENCNFDFSVRSSNFYLLCRYVKKRMLLQKNKICQNCKGKKCELCKFIRNNNAKSIENIARKKFLSYTNSDNVIFQWTGNEDINSQVLGKGRPFVAQIINPRKRIFSNFKVFGNGVTIFVDKCTTNKELQTKFKIKSRLYLETLKKINYVDVDKINQLSEKIIEYNYNSTFAYKKIYTISAKIIDTNTLIIEMISDNGISYKQFIEGESLIEPNISSCIKNKCKCIKFDILDVII
ncbi:MAG: hypothetical protein ACPKQO_06560 [Nitrososphaeraceae archaeon]